jgi:hypothetical protein
MAEKKSADELAGGIDLESGQAHTLELDGKFQFWLQLGDEIDGLDLVIEDANGQEEQRIPASQATADQDGFRWFDLSQLAEGAHRVRVQAGADAAGPTFDLAVDALDRSFAAEDASAAADAFGLAGADGDGEGDGDGDGDGEGDAGADSDDSDDSDENLDTGDDDTTDPDEEPRAWLLPPDAADDANDGAQTPGAQDPSDANA